MANNDSGFRRFWDAIGAVGNLQTLWQIALALGITRWRFYKMNITDWSTPGPWIGVGLWFFGGWAGIATVFTIVRRSTRPLLAMIFAPAKFRLRTESGIEAAIAIENLGMPTRYIAEGRIVEMRDGSPNLRPGRFRCVIKKTDGTIYDRHYLWIGAKDELRIVIAEMELGNDQGYHLMLLLGAKQQIQVPDAGVRVEVIVESEPRWGPPPPKEVHHFSLWRESQHHPYIHIDEIFMKQD